MIMLHNPSIIGGSWLQDETKLVALSGFDSMTVAVKIKDTSIIDMKQKISRLQDIQDAITTRMPFQSV